MPRWFLCPELYGSITCFGLVTCWVKGLQLKTGCPVEDYFKLWFQKLKLWVVEKLKNQSSKSMRTRGIKFDVKTRPQNCQKLENVFGKIEIFLAQNPIFLAQNLLFFNGFPISEKSKKIFFNGFPISSTAFRFLWHISNFHNGFLIFLNGFPQRLSAFRNGFLLSVTAFCFP